MKAAIRPSLPVPLRRGLGGALALLALGLLGNHFPFTLFYNADLIFGGIFAMLALQLYGVLRGTVLAALISLPLFLLWGHPYGSVIMTAEVAVVGWLAQRRGLGWVQADALYWLCLGMPAVFVCYHLLLKTPAEGALFVMAKDMMNGITNILVARFLYLALTRKGGAGRVSFRELLYDLLVCFVVCPGLLMIAVESRRDLARVDRQMRAELVQDGRQLTHMIRTWVDNRQAVVSHLAYMAGSMPTPALQGALEHAGASDRNFLRMGWQDQDGIVRAHYPLFDEAGHTYLGRDFSDRPYIRTMKQTLRPVLSQVVLARGGVPVPQVGLVAPAVVQGRYAGYVIAVLALDQIQENLHLNLDDRGGLFTLLDREGRVIASNRPGQKVMGALDRGPGTFQRLDDQVSRWLPPQHRGATAMARWGSSFQVASFPIGEKGDWTLVLEQPVAPFQRAFFQTYAGELGGLVLVVLAALVLAEAISRKLFRGFEHLADLTQDLPATLAAGGAAIHWPEREFREASDLVANFRTMADTLAEQFQQVRQVNERLEARVAERTRALAEREARYLALFDLSPDGLSITRLADGSLRGVNAAWTAMFGYSAEEARGQTTLGLGLYADPPGRVELFGRIATSGLLPATVVHLLRRDRTPFVAELTGRVLDVDGERCLLTVLRDVTQDRAMRQQALDNEVRARKAESLVLMAGSIAHDFNNLFQALLAGMEIAELKAHDHPEVLRAIGSAKDVLRQATGLSWKMLDFSGRAIARPVPVRLPELVGAWAQGPPRPQVQARLDLDLGEVPAVMTDPDKFPKVLDELLDNALEAMAEAGLETGRVRVRVSQDARRPDDPGLWVAERPPGPSTVCLAFSNDGPIPPPEVLARMFDPFYTTRALGRGLGLPSALGLLQALGAGVQVAGEGELGLVFRIHFPLAEA